MELRHGELGHSVRVRGRFEAATWDVFLGWPRRLRRRVLVACLTDVQGRLRNEGGLPFDVVEGEYRALSTRAGIQSCHWRWRGCRWARFRPLVLSAESTPSPEREVIVTLRLLELALEPVWGDGG